MSEEYKVSIPLITNKELEIFDNNIHEIIEEYSKMYFREKDQILTQRIIMKQEEEIDHLHTIIKEVREYIEEKYEILLKDEDFLDHDELVDRKRILHILEILDKADKDSDKE